MGRVRHRAALLVLLLVAAALSGCASAAHPELTVGPASAPFDSDLTIRVTGLQPGEHATLRLASQSTDGTTWTADAVYAADGAGVASTADAPVSGDYRGAQVMGLAAALHPTSGTAWFAVSRSTPWRMTVTASADGSVIGTRTVTRRLCHTRTTMLTPAHGGLFGEFDEPLTPAAAQRPAVVVFGGSEGGLDVRVQACLLAEHGYPALALAYFDEPGLPQHLADIPLEYFARAAALLAKQPGVDPRRIVLWGDSRGSEAALLTAADFPALVDSVVASVPSAVANEALGDPAVTAWTFRGQPVAIDSVIPVERITGPLLLVCGGADEVWTSCPNAELIRDRLRAAHADNAVTLLDYPQAGHFVGSLFPDYPEVATTGRSANGVVDHSGGTALATNEAMDAGWVRLLGWLRALRR